MGLADSARGLWERLKGEKPRQDAAENQKQRGGQSDPPPVSVEAPKVAKKPETLLQSRQKTPGPAERLMPEHKEALTRAAEPKPAQVKKEGAIEPSRMEYTRTAQPAPNLKMAGVQYPNPRSHASRPSPANDAGKAKSAPDKTGPAAETAKPVRTINDFRRGEPERKPQKDEENRPTGRLIDQYRRPTGPDLGKTR